MLRSGSEMSLVRLALDLGAARCGGPLSAAEEELVSACAGLPPTSTGQTDHARDAIREGYDPLGKTLCQLRPPQIRRPQGLFYTPPPIVRSMVDWILYRDPLRVIDPGCGSARFSAEIIRRRPDLSLIAIDADPLQTLLTRAVLAVL